MPRSILLLLLGIAACTDRTGPDAHRCSGTPSPTADFCGTWKATPTVMGSALTMRLRFNDQVISGDGTYAIEAGRRGVFTIDGALRQPYLDLTFQYDYGVRLQYRGRLGPEDRITGATIDSLGNTYPLSFVPQ